MNHENDYFYIVQWPTSPNKPFKNPVEISLENAFVLLYSLKVGVIIRRFVKHSIGSILATFGGNGR